MTTDDGDKEAKMIQQTKMPGAIESGATVIVRRPGRTRGFRMRLDEHPEIRANGYLKLRGWRVRKDGAMLNWTSEYVPWENVQRAPEDMA